jgi:hypothetical protein
VVLGTAAAGGFKAHALVFDAGDNPLTGFGGAAEPGFPVPVQGDPVNAALAGIGLPAVGFAGGDVDAGA